MLLLGLMSLVIGVGANFPLVKKYLNGEFRQSFLSDEESSLITYISLSEAEELSLREDVLFIDSRRKILYQESHIPGAVNVDYEEVRDSGFDLPAETSLDQILVIYCDGSECRSSSELAKLYAHQGCKDIRVFFGGWDEWQAAGLPIVRGNAQE
jgi:3-mercaptopyruvate sulfurtransferase SseA